MKKRPGGVFRRLFVTLWGLLYGIAGSFLGILGAAFTFPESSPGSRDYEEDRSFIPLGIVMLLICLLTGIFSYYRLRKSRIEIIIFSAALAIGSGSFFLLAIYH